MISFDFTEEQQMLVDSVRRYAEREMRKSIHDMDEARQLPDGLIDKGWELGLIPSSIPEEYDGFGEHSAITGVLYAEELAWGDVSATLALLAPNLVSIPVLEYGTAEQKESLLPKFCDDEFFCATSALVEPSITFDPYNLKTKAINEDGHYILNGNKVYVPLADTANYVLVYANEDGKTQGFLVEKDTTGLQIVAREHNMGLGALPTYKVNLENCKLPATAKIGGEEGLNFERLHAYSNVALAAMAVGQAKASYEYAVEYAKDRQAFGEAIAQRQSIAFMLADMATEIDGTRLMVWETAWKLDQGENASQEATLVRRYASDMVLTVTDGSVQTLGGHGYIRDHPVEMWLRNGRGFAIFDGIAIV
ncbi:MAG: acyl-CoA dehydrogenase [Anaerolineaceae bacterium 4572_78]|nr:MAG: acyl-CoA dehydrogenase [Anaerolineaceae bacterium 4572_78]